MKFALTAVLGMLFVCGAYAQAAQPALVTPVLTPSADPPFIVPAHEIKGIALVKALRAGGFVLYMRHAFAGSPKAPCLAESVLTEEGEAQARQVGAALRELKIPIAVIRASETCRAKDTARLLGLGVVTTDANLNPAVMRSPVANDAERFRYLLETPPPGSNTLLVSHVQGAQKLEDRILIELAEVVVYQAHGNTKAEPLARIPLSAWAGLIAVAKAEPIP